MPIYEYQSSGNAGKWCEKCRRPFEVLQNLGDRPLRICPSCGNPVRRLISWCRSAVVEVHAGDRMVERKIKEYENSGMWSHAAELADKHSDQFKDKALRERALDDYKKAGYDVDSLAKHDQKSDE